MVPDDPSALPTICKLTRLSYHFLRPVTGPRFALGLAAVRPPQSAAGHSPRPQVGLPHRDRAADHAAAEGGGGAGGGSGRVVGTREQGQAHRGHDVNLRRTAHGLRPRTQSHGTLPPQHTDT